MVWNLIVEEFLKHGTMGVVALVALWGYFRKDKQLHEFYERQFERMDRMRRAQDELSRELDATLRAGFKSVSEKREL